MQTQTEIDREYQLDDTYLAPIPLQWQWTIDETNEVVDVDDTNEVNSYMTYIDSADSFDIPLMHPTLSGHLSELSFSVPLIQWGDEDDNAEPDTISEESISLIIKQFGRSGDSLAMRLDDPHGYAANYMKLVHGYVRRMERKIAQLVPDQLISLCCTFYNEPESEYVVLGFNVYRHFSSQPLSQPDVKPPTKHSFCGQALHNFIGEHESLSDSQSLTVCVRLLKTRIIEIVSATFSSLFMSHSNSASTLPNRPRFVASTDHIYDFTERFQIAFDQYSRWNFSFLFLKIIKETSVARQRPAGPARVSNDTKFSKKFCTCW